MREVILGVLLALAGGLVVAGFAVLFGAGIAFIVAGVLLAGLAVLTFGDVPDAGEAE